MLKLNVVANLIGSGILVILPTISLPLYLTVLNNEKYGLFTLYFIIIIYFRVLDFGITATFNRYVALKKNNETDKIFIRKLLQNYEIIFLLISLIIFIIIFYFSNYFASQWIISTNLLFSNISTSIKLIGLIIGLRFFLTLYRSGINGFEKQVWLNTNKVFFEFSTIFGGLVFCYIVNYFIEFKMYYLFLYIIFFNLIEILVLRIKILKIINIPSRLSQISFEPLYNTYKTMFLLGTTGSLWFFVLCFDRLIFSRLLSLKEFGFYVSVTVLSTICLLIAVTINTALLPRITNLFSQKNIIKFKTTYNAGFCLNLCLSCSLTITFCLFSEKILIVWTGNSELANWGYNVLMIYSVGYFFISLVHSLTTLLTAMGKLKIVTIANLFWAPILTMLFFISATYYDYLYAGLAWLFCNFMLFILLAFLILIYEDFYIEKRHLIFQFFKIMALSLAIFYFFNFVFVIPFYEQRVMMLMQIFLINGLVLLTLLSALKETRVMMYYVLTKFKIIIF